MNSKRSKKKVSDLLYLWVSGKCFYRCFTTDVCEQDLFETPGYQRKYVRQTNCPFSIPKGVTRVTIWIFLLLFPAKISRHGADNNFFPKADRSLYSRTFPLTLKSIQFYNSLVFMPSFLNTMSSELHEVTCLFSPGGFWVLLSNVKHSHNFFVPFLWQPLAGAN